MAALTACDWGLYCFQPQRMAACLTCRPDVVCPNRLGGMMQPAKATHGAFLARRKLVPPGRRARCARFPTCGVVRVAGYSVVWDCDPTSIFFPKSTKRSAAAIFGRSAPSYVLWCTSEYSVVGRISCHVSHDNIGINVCQRSFAEFFLAAADSESNRFYPCFRESRDVVSADIPVC